MEKTPSWSQITAIKKGCTARIPEAIQSTQSVVLAYQFQLLHCGTVLSFGATWRPGRILAHIHIAIVTHRAHRLQPLRDRSSPLRLTNLAPPLSVRLPRQVCVSEAACVIHRVCITEPACFNHRLGQNCQQVTKALKNSEQKTPKKQKKTLIFFLKLSLPYFVHKALFSTTFLIHDHVL